MFNSGRLRFGKLLVGDAGQSSDVVNGFLPINMYHVDAF
jgi:hypothetical protein